MATIGTPLSESHAAQLRLALLPMVKQIRAAMPKINSPAKARALGAALRREWPDKRIAEIVRRFGIKAEAAASRGWRKPRGDARAYDERKLVNKWSKNASKLITSVRDEVAEEMRRDVVAALESGADATALASKWRSSGIPVAFGTLEGRIKVIAQHQISMLHAEVQRERAASVGVTEFIWRTQGDDSVRDEHAALDGEVFSYNDPPSEGLPGTPVNCRCWAESVIPDDVLGDFGLS